MEIEIPMLSNAHDTCDALWQQIRSGRRVSVVYLNEEPKAIDAARVWCTHLQVRTGGVWEPVPSGTKFSAV